MQVTLKACTPPRKLIKHNAILLTYSPLYYQSTEPENTVQAYLSHDQVSIKILRSFRSSLTGTGPYDPSLAGCTLPRSHAQTSRDTRAVPTNKG